MTFIGADRSDRPSVLTAFLFDPVEGRPPTLPAETLAALEQGGVRLLCLGGPGAAAALLAEGGADCALVALPAQGPLPDLALEALLAREPSLRLIGLAENGRGWAPSRQADLARLLRQGLLHDLQPWPPQPQALLAALAHQARLGALGRAAPLPSDATAAAPEDDIRLLGESAPMRKVKAAIRRFAAVDAPVLITGESGTGKELAARAVHEASASRGGPFVAINCPGIPATLAESEFFGYEKGAFTGAYQRKTGRIEAADGGTCFLDEIGDLPVEIQGHLLRFLQEKTLQHVGGTKTISVAVRVLSATNVALEEAIRQGRFREDLFYRLNVLTLWMPPLRERGEDIDLLATTFLRRLSAELGRTLLGFRPGAVARLRAHPWPGNVRQLLGVVRRAVVMADGKWINASDLGLSPADDMLEERRRPVPTLQEARAEAERDLIRRTLDRHGYNIMRSARDLGVSRVTLYRLLGKHAIKLPDQPLSA